MPTSPAQPDPHPEVVHNAAVSRYEITLSDGGNPALLEYHLRPGGDGQPDIVTFTHTYVPPSLRGRGVAERLVRTALADAREAGARIVPVCSYVARFIEQHHEFADLLHTPPSPPPTPPA
ncbi:putative acetyltransferase [Opitutaceae bacterium TAV1]|nr:putative acetyltransferase [Opitutaceae bacterium TAV1]